MDIGTAKPTVAERAAVPHHCLDLADPEDGFTVVQFREAYDQAVGHISTDAIVVAGTGLYLRSVIDRLDPPGQWPAIRTELEADADLGRLYDQLRLLDPVAAGRTEPANRRRIVRALEVCLGSGQPFSSFGPGLEHYPDVDIVQIGLRWPRAALRRRIAARYREQMDAGFLDEVRTLTHRRLSRTASQALGYRELLAHLQGEMSLADALDLAITRTGQFAVRQERWFRRDPRIRWVDVADDPLEALPLVLEALAR